MKLWQKDTTINKRIEDFTVGKDRELDLWLAQYDILGSLAHIQMLESIQLLESTELEQLQIALKQLYQQVQQDNFVIEDGIRDVERSRGLGDVYKRQIYNGANEYLGKLIL